MFKVLISKPNYLKTRNDPGIGLTILLGVSILLALLLLSGQTFALINYDLMVSMGLQESEEEVTKLGVAWAKAFAIGDTVFYLPLLIAGIIGLSKRTKWGFYCMFASLAVSVYWPIVNLTVIYIGRDAMILHPDKYVTFPIVLILVIIYGCWGMLYLFKHQKSLLR